MGEIVSSIFSSIFTRQDDREQNPDKYAEPGEAPRRDPTSGPGSPNYAGGNNPFTDFMTKLYFEPVERVFADQNYSAQYERNQREKDFREQNPPGTIEAAPVNTTAGTLDTSNRIRYGSGGGKVAAAQTAPDPLGNKRSLLSSDEGYTSGGSTSSSSLG